MAARQFGSPRCSHSPFHSVTTGTPRAPAVCPRGRRSRPQGKRMLSSTRIIAKSAALIAFVLAAMVVTPAAAATITVMTYNTRHGGLAKTPPTTDAEIALIAAQNPDVVVLQEGYTNQVSYYVNGLNSRLGTTAWHGASIKHCKAGTAPTCTTWSSEVVMVLTRLKTVAADSLLIWAKDDYFAARGAVQMTIAAADGTLVNVFGCHLPANKNAEASRLTYVTALQNWAQSFASPRLIGGDFNATSDLQTIAVMTQRYDDAWLLAGTGPGYTHTHDGTTATTRIDYWFSDADGAETV